MLVSMKCSKLMECKWSSLLRVHDPEEIESITQKASPGDCSVVLIHTEESVGWKKVSLMYDMLKLFMALTVNDLSTGFVKSLLINLFPIFCGGWGH